MLQNSLVEGWIRHRRYQPKRHEFNYGMHWTLLDLDTVQEQFKNSALWSVERFNLVSYRAGDFHYGLSKEAAPAVKEPIANKLAVYNSIKKKTGKTFSGKVYMLSHLRSYGYNFNSACFYFCYEEETLKFIICEITNTPWGERHSYVLDCEKSKRGHVRDLYQFEFDKQFHVSPYISMDMLYRWTFKINKSGLRVHMVVLNQAKAKYFDATFTGKFVSLNKKTMNKLATRYALQPLKMSLAIYWQAMKLWLKRVKFYDHPKHNEQ
ncbi:DUF1365 domain-containing protein [Kangiella sediminilitoris]|uniref:Chromosome partitioning protein ParA n=1 Tax=Kangiella sediminilitoris TaxID=1144748 RepID=A0A1B3B850_9GAMM|nr:DUF1365 domain-containing protein [Kangiella sediminilitoris]AOE48967.1 hypothetical protein KS2013_239 [Kangiella sediminilitoris]